jgi:hypothetical protein
MIWLVSLREQVTSFVLCIQFVAISIFIYMDINTHYFLRVKTPFCFKEQKIITNAPLSTQILFLFVLEYSKEKLLDRIKVKITSVIPTLGESWICRE